MPTILNPWPYSYIIQLATEASYQAEAEQLRPALANEVITNYRHSHRLNIPFLGGYVHPEWERLDDLDVFVDSSGQGQPGEPALTQLEFYQRILRHSQAAERDGIGYGVIEVGQTQALVATYQRKEKRGSQET
jgi:hypothetical protein